VTAKINDCAVLWQVHFGVVDLGVLGIVERDAGPRFSALMSALIQAADYGQMPTDLHRSAHLASAPTTSNYCRNHGRQPLLQSRQAPTLAPAANTHGQKVGAVQMPNRSIAAAECCSVGVPLGNRGEPGSDLRRYRRP
jgi:hypothetical protein